MKELLFLLLPIAAFSGWYLGIKSKTKNSKLRNDKFSSKYLHGLNYVLNEQTDRAVDIFLQMLDIDGDVVEIHLMLGSLFRRRGEVDRAIKIHKSILLRSNLPQEYCNLLKIELAKDYIHAGLLDRAELILLELVEHNIEEETSLALLGSIYEESKDWDKAIDIHLKLQAVSSTKYNIKIAQFYCELAKNAIHIKNFSQAKEYIQQALKQDETCIRAYILSGECEIEQGKYIQAIALFEKIIKHSKNYKDVDNYLFEIVSKIIFCYMILGKTESLTDFWHNINISNGDNVGVILAYTNYLQETKGEVVALEYLTKEIKTNYSILGLSKIVELNLLLATDRFKHNLDSFKEVIDKILQKTYNYRCVSCGLTSKILEWRCPSCKGWGTFRIAALFELN